jgi:hypothetical protein
MTQEPKETRIGDATLSNKRFIRRYKAPRGGFGKIHSEYFRRLADNLVAKRRRVELDFRKRPREYRRYPDDGFTVGKAIRDRKGKIIRVEGKISIPDLVDYKEDRIYDVKTIMWSLIFCLPKTEKGELDNFTAEDIVKLVVHRNKSQLERYLKAYWFARDRLATLMLSIEGFDRRVVCVFHPAMSKWFIIEDEIKIKTIERWIDQN